MSTLINNNLSFVSIGSSVTTDISSTANTLFLRNDIYTGTITVGRATAVPNTQTLRSAYKFTLEPSGPQNVTDYTFPELLQPPYNIGDGANGEWTLCTDDLTISGAPGKKKIYKDLFDYQRWQLSDYVDGTSFAPDGIVGLMGTQIDIYNNDQLPLGVSYYTAENHPLYKTNLDPNALHYGPSYPNKAILYGNNQSLESAQAEWGYFNNVPEPEPFFDEIQNSLAQAYNYSANGVGLGNMNSIGLWGAEGNPFTHKVFSFDHEGYIHADASLIQGTSNDSQFYSAGLISYGSAYDHYNSSWANKDFASGMYDGLEADYILDGIVWDLDNNGNQLDTGYNSEYDMKFTDDYNNSALRRWPTVGRTTNADIPLTKNDKFLKYVVLFNTDGVQRRQDWLNNGFEVANISADYYGKEQTTIGVSGNKVIAIACLNTNIAPNGQGQNANTLGSTEGVSTTSSSYQNTTFFGAVTLDTPSSENGWMSNFINEIDFEGEAKFLQTS